MWILKYPAKNEVRSDLKKQIFHVISTYVNVKRRAIQSSPVQKYRYKPVNSRNIAVDIYTHGKQLR
jgi:septum formation topological specificity factor MinE